MVRFRLRITESDIAFIKVRPNVWIKEIFVVKKVEWKFEPSISTEWINVFDVEIRSYSQWSEKKIEPTNRRNLIKKFQTLTGEQD